MGMFEQSMLLDTRTSKRTGAVAASLTLQTLAVGLLFLIPLLYSDRLPLIRPWLSITIPLPPPIPEPPVERMIARTDAARPSLITPRVFHREFAQPTIPTMQAILSQMTQVPSCVVRPEVGAADDRIYENPEHGRDGSVT